ncbi:MAG TPA: RNA polymerase sigma factor [Bacteroidales bacterium]|nr:RNA polymerase sigma factor [Bacteroidales bacterium]HPS71660.1 RNA polymerase sigma factor [Bacteroidales bacterium]
MKIISKNKVKKVDEMFFKNLKKGDSKTLQSFYDIYASSIYTTILRYVNHIPDAEDLLQESLLKIIDSLDKFSYTNESAFYSWMKKIAVNLTLNYLRDQSKFQFVDEYPLELIPDLNDDEQLNNLELNPNELLRMISELPAGYKAVLNLYVFEQYSHKEIATTLGISESTSKTQLMKARKLLKTKFENKYSFNIQQYERV